MSQEGETSTGQHDGNGKSLNIVDEDPVGVYVKDLSGIYVKPCEKSNLISFFADKFSYKDLDTTRAYCRAVNNSCHVVKATSSDEPDSDGDFLVTFEYDFLLYPCDSVSTKTILKIARDVVGYMAFAIKECDSDLIFKRS